MHEATASWVKNPESVAYKGLRISYPNENDIANAKKYGKNAGGDIMIHGLKNNTRASEINEHPNMNWTAGCIAVTNTEMEEIYNLVKVGTVIEIKP